MVPERCQLAGITVVSTGSEPSILTWCRIQGVRLPARSVTRMSTTLSPSSVIVRLAVVVVSPARIPGRLYSIRATPESASTALTVSVAEFFRQIVFEPPVVVSMGSTLSPIVPSTSISSRRQGDQLPAASRTRVSSSCEPWPATVARAPGAPEKRMPSIFHWTASTPEPVPSLPVTATWYGSLESPGSGDAVVLVGTVASTRIVSSCTPETLPATSRARVLS